MRDSRPRTALALFLGALLGLLLVVMGVGRSLDLRLLDHMQGTAPLAEPQVVLVDLDARTLATYGWPIDPSLYAAVFDTLRSAGAEGIGVDLILAESGIRLMEEPAAEGDPGDALLGLMATDLGLVLGVQRVKKGEPAVGTCGVDSSQPLVPLRRGLEAAPRGHLHVRADPTDGVMRWAIPCISTPDGCVRDLSSTLLGREPDCEDSLIPYARSFEGFPRISLYDVVDRSGSEEGREALRGLVDGRYVLVGPSDASVADVGRTPASSHEPLYTVHANRLQALLEGRSLTPMAPGTAGCFGVVFTLLLTRSRWPARGWMVAAAAGLALAWGGSLGVFRGADIWLPWTGVAFPWVLGCLGAAAHQGWRHLRHNQMVTQAFGRYVSPDVLDWLKDSGGAALASSAAERREIAVLFSDVAGYTRLSNRLGPDAVMQSLRLYLDVMVPIVQKHGGYLDKINGDGLMVLFGAPRRLSDNSAAAVACALEMQEAVRTMQVQWAAITDGPLVIRVGVATGEAFVGNLGAEGHFEYTAIGPVVNLAARLESKAPLGGMALSEQTHAALASPPAGEWVGLELKGYDGGDVQAWAVPGESLG